MSSDDPPHVLHEAAHKSEAPAGADAPVDGRAAAERPKPGGRRVYNEAAHKMPYRQAYKVRPPSDDEVPAFARGEHDVIAHASRAVLALGALGVVYGDIGTSPLYTEQTIFKEKAAAHINPATIYGANSMIFWSLMIVVSVKYAGVIMRAHNHGDGGIMALTALVQRRHVAHTAVLVTLGIFGAALFLGDGMITPAISVLSAVEGLKVVDPGLAHLVVPIALGILITLFVVQRFGTGTVGWLFGPVMLVWFSVLAVAGFSQIVQHPGIFQALSPTWGARFMVAHGFESFLALGAIVLAVTGAEALYADRGHFGPVPIRVAWFGVVLPGVLLNYLGQGALILSKPHTVSNPFFLLIPGWGQSAMVVLATIATIIASQAVISGSYSVARQAVTLGFLPRLKITHTSKMEGHIYVPAVNWTLCIGVAALTVGFQASAKLANAYGVAVTGTFILNTILFLVVARSLWGIAKWKLAVFGTGMLIVEVAFFTSNLAKIFHGAWLPLVVGAAVSALMIIWRNGREVVTRNRTHQEGDLHAFLESLQTADPKVYRVPGVAVFLNPSTETTPLALRAQVRFTHALQEKVVIFSVANVSVPYVQRKERFQVHFEGPGRWKVVHVTARFGYREKVDVPAALQLARKLGLLERNLDLEHASYFISRITILPSECSGLVSLRKRIFMAMARNAASPMDLFALPSDRTVVMGSQVPL